MNQVAQQNAALVEQAAAASRAMQQQEAQTAQVASIFKSDEMLCGPVAPLANAAQEANGILEHGRSGVAIFAKFDKPVQKNNAFPAFPSKDGWEEF